MKDSAASETFQITENTEVIQVLLQGCPSVHPGVLQVLGGCASPALLPSAPGEGGFTITIAWLLDCFTPQLRTAKPEGFQVHRGPLDATEV